MFASEVAYSLHASLLGSINEAAAGMYLMVLSEEAEEEEIASKFGWKSLQSFILALKRFCVTVPCSW